MKDFCVSIVKNMTGVDTFHYRDFFCSYDYDGPCVWFIDVPYNEQMYKAVKVYPHSINFYEKHPLAQRGPNIKFKIGLAQ